MGIPRIVVKQRADDSPGQSRRAASEAELSKFRVTSKRDAMEDKLALMKTLHPAAVDLGKYALPKESNIRIAGHSDGKALAQQVASEKDKHLHAAYSGCRPGGGGSEWRGCCDA